MNAMQPSLQAVKPAVPTEKHSVANRRFQGIPGIAVSSGGRAFATCYAGRQGEGPDNHVLLFLSDDHGVNWTEAVAVVDHPHPNVRAFDPVVWLAPDGRFFLFWTQSFSEEENHTFDGRSGVWFSVLETPDGPASEFRWTPSRRIGDGIMMNKPTVLRDGTWALPISMWHWKGLKERDRAPRSEVGAKMVVSRDAGETFQELGKTVVPDDLACFDEHTIVEEGSGRLRMIIRVNFGNMESFSSDGGKTWSAPIHSSITGPNSRLFMGRLQSGNLLLVNHDYQPPAENPLEWGPRQKMTAWLSVDDGRTWPHQLLLDERDGVSYPDAVQEAGGRILIIYDRDRSSGGFIHLARISEDDLVAERVVTPGSFLKGVVSSYQGLRGHQR
jgi:hypothetical protein